jgi:protein O-GlcNAc transferase
MTLELAMKLHGSGDLDEAEKAYRRVLAGSPFNCQAMEKLALICLSTGRAEEGRKYLNNAVKINPKNAETHMILGSAHWMLGNIDDAISSIRTAISLGGETPEACLNLGDALKANGQTQEALSAYEKSVASNPKFWQGHNALGGHYLELGQLDLALSHFQQVVKYNPEFVAAHHNLGIVYQNTGRFDEAVSACKKALALQQNALTYANLGNTYLFSYYTNNNSQGLDLGIEAFKQAIKLQPDLALAYVNLGQALKEQNHFEEAIKIYNTGLQFHPNNSDLWLNLALAYHALFRFDEAHGCYQRVLQERCRKISIDSPVRKIGIMLLEMLKLPTIYASQDDILSARGFYTGCLNQACTLIESMPEPLTAEEAQALRWILFLLTNFYLSYHQADDKPLMAKYAKLATSILQTELAPYLEPITERKSQGKIRVGVASAYLSEHHGSMWAYDWLSNLPKDDYEFYFYSLNGKTDAYTQKFASLGTFRWFDFRESNYLSILQSIKEDGLDILFFTDIGMNPASRIISLARLAPMQCVGWGHPGTTGAPNIDYFISNELMEPANAAEHYSETLVKFKNLGLTLAYPRESDAQGKREQFGLPADKHLYGNVQSLFKSLPQYDHVYTEIAKRDPLAFFVFAASLDPNEALVLGKRLREAFAQQGMNFDERGKILARTSYRGYMELLSVLDVNLDCIGWSGGYTTMDSLAMNLPIVTTAGEFMRGRLCQAMLRVVGIDELIGKNVDDYVDIAVKVGTNSDFRETLIERIKREKNKLFNDLESVKELDTFWKENVRTGHS